MLNNFLNNYFGFNKQQRNGLMVLVLISFFLLLTRLIYPIFITDDTMIISNLPLIENRIDSAYNTSQKELTKEITKTTLTNHLFNFDPNTVTFEELIRLGFKDKLAKTFLKFRSKGFCFKQKNDLKKVYGISTNFYTQLEPYIQFKNNNVAQTTNPNNLVETQSKKQNIQIIELNAADSLALVNLNGLGPTFTRRILKYRRILGGFISIEQLNEVYGFTPELFAKIKPYVNVNPLLIKKINLNKDDFKSVNKHPYLSYELTKTLFDWRKKTVITTINLKDIINDPVLYSKLIPYLVFE